MNYDHINEQCSFVNKIVCAQSIADRRSGWGDWVSPLKRSALNVAGNEESSRIRGSARRIVRRYSAAHWDSLLGSGWRPM